MFTNFETILFFVPRVLQRRFLKVSVRQEDSVCALVVLALEYSFLHSRRTAVMFSKFPDNVFSIPTQSSHWVLQIPQNSSHHDTV